MELKVLGEQINDAMDDFVEEDEENRACAFVLVDCRKKEAIYSGNGMSDIASNALVCLLHEFAVRTDDPEGFLANLFIKTFAVLKNGEDEEQ